ncbi:MAG TPA: hypothetical protein VEL72_02330, partial [Ktedonobacteraceae bacterium]|nr:hypothetical protein [Ktedonobacteraceae bacterium]
MCQPTAGCSDLLLTVEAGSWQAVDHPKVQFLSNPSRYNLVRVSVCGCGILWHHPDVTLIHPGGAKRRSERLYSGGFVRKDHRWFPASDTSAAARQLRAALLETLVQGDQEEPTQPLSSSDHQRTRVRAIHKRLAEIVSEPGQSKVGVMHCFASSSVVAELASATTLAQLTMQPG